MESNAVQPVSPVAIRSSQRVNGAWDEVRKLMDTVGLDQEKAAKLLPTDEAAVPGQLQRMDYKGKHAEDLLVPQDVFERVQSAATRTVAPDEAPAMSPGEFKKAVKAAQAKVAEPIHELRKQLGEVEKEVTELMFGDKKGLFAKPREESELSPEETEKLDGLKERAMELSQEAAALGQAGRTLTALRGETSFDRFGLMFIGGLSFVPQRGVAGLGLMWIPQFTPRDPETGKREVKANTSLGGSVFGTFGISKVFGKKQLATSISAFGVYSIEHPVFGTNVGGTWPGIGFGGIAIKPNGNAAIEGGPAIPLVILPKTYATVGFMIEHPMFEPIVKPLIEPAKKAAQWLQGKIKGIVDSVSGEVKKIRSRFQDIKEPKDQPPGPTLPGPMPA